MEGNYRLIINCVTLFEFLKNLMNNFVEKSVNFSCRTRFAIETNQDDGSIEDKNFKIIGIDWKISSDSSERI